MVKLIVSDFDGTLLPYGQRELSCAQKDFISRALTSGIAVAVSSGRTCNELASYLPEFKDSLYFIGCDGAYYLKNGRLLFIIMYV